MLKASSHVSELDRTHLFSFLSSIPKHWWVWSKSGFFCQFFISQKWNCDTCGNL